MAKAVFIEMLLFEMCLVEACKGKQDGSNPIGLITFPTWLVLIQRERGNKILVCMTLGALYGSVQHGLWYMCVFIVLYSVGV